MQTEEPEREYEIGVMTLLSVKWAFCFLHNVTLCCMLRNGLVVSLLCYYFILAKVVVDVYVNSQNHSSVSPPQSIIQPHLTSSLPKSSLHLIVVEGRTEVQWGLLANARGIFLNKGIKKILLQPFEMKATCSFWLF